MRTTFTLCVRWSSHGFRQKQKDTARVSFCFWWKRVGSNHWPPACQAGTLTNWATLPYELIIHPKKVFVNIFFQIIFLDKTIDISFSLCYNENAKQIEYLVKGYFFYIGDIIPFFCILYAIWTLVKLRTPRRRVCKYPYPSICLATIGVCVFGAVTSVAALFDLKGGQT